MGQKNGKQQKPMEEEKKDANQPIVIKLKTKKAHRRLPLEMNCEIFKCLKLPIQRKFMSGMGKGIYGMFGPKIRALLKTKKLNNPKNNGWREVEAMEVTISPNGLRVDTDTHQSMFYVSAKKRFDVSVEECRKDNFPGNIIYYYELTQMSWSTLGDYFMIGLMDLNKSNIDDDGNRLPGHSPKFYSSHCRPDYCYLGDHKEHHFEWPNGVIEPEWNSYGKGDVVGCGILLNSKNEWAIFFTGNGILMGKQIPISINTSPENGPLRLLVKMKNISLEANFGDDATKPFKYDIEKCPGLVFE